MYRAAIFVSVAGKGVSYGTSPGPLPQMCARLCDPYAWVESVDGQCAGCGLAIAKWTAARPPALRGPSSEGSLGSLCHPVVRVLHTQGAPNKAAPFTLF